MDKGCVSNKKRIILAGVFIDKLMSAFTKEDEIVKSFGNKRFDLDKIISEQIDLAIFFGYGFQIEQKYLEKSTFINLHGSYLPYGKGPHPHIWGWIKNDPFGVTIHRMSAGMDEGDIIFQRKLNLDPNENTISTTLDALVTQAAELFIEKWPLLRNGNYTLTPQTSKGSSHFRKDSVLIQDIIDQHRHSPIPTFMKEVAPRLIK